MFCPILPIGLVKFHKAFHQVSPHSSNGKVPQPDHDEVVPAFEPNEILPTSVSDAGSSGGSRIINSVTYKELRKNMTIDNLVKWNWKT